MKTGKESGTGKDERSVSAPSRKSDDADKRTSGTKGREEESKSNSGSEKSRSGSGSQGDSRRS